MQTQELWPGGPVFRQSEHFRFGTDSLLLADFVPLRGAKRGVDLGCGSGILTLLPALRSEALHMTGLELQAEAAAAARENLALNGLAERCAILEGDLRRCREIFPAGGFDLVLSNPPYFKEGSGAASPRAERAAARSESCCSLEELCAAAAWLLRTGGCFCLVHRPERLSELCCRLSAAGLEPKRLRFAANRAESAPSLVLLEARRGGRPGLTVEPTLFLRGPDGAESEELRRICRR